MTTTITAKLEVIARGLLIAPSTVMLVRQRGKSWSFLPGGHVEPGDATTTAALLRELREEADIEVQANRVESIGRVEHSYVEDGVHHHEENLVFAVHLPDDNIRSREAHLEYHAVPHHEFAMVSLRPQALHAELLKWWQTRAPFTRSLPAG
ncbi:MAG: NUDIX domain-containing protein [Mycobacterium sp.]|nr:NUDIX domain-containing protein [Mycobacterium sp.]